MDTNKTSGIVAPGKAHECATSDKKKDGVKAAQPNKTPEKHEEKPASSSAQPIKS